MYTVMAIKIEPRNSIAPKVQEVLTEFGCIIQTRLGLHEVSKDNCSNAGLIILNLISDKIDEIENLMEELNNLQGVIAKLIKL